MGKICDHVGCTKRPTYGAAGTNTAEFCSGHAMDGMMDVVNKKFRKTCDHVGCTKRPTYGTAGTNTGKFCSRHALDGMMDVVNKKCTHPGCTKGPCYGVAGTNKRDFCSEHAKDGMVNNVYNKKCTHPGCTKRPTYGAAGTKNSEFCSGHAKDGMVDVYNKKCAHPGCTKRPHYGMAGSFREFCAQHAQEGMVCFNTSQKQSSGAHGKSGGRQVRGDGVWDGGSTRRVGVGGKRNDSSPFSSQMDTPPGRGKVGSKRARQAPFPKPVTPTSNETAIIDDTHTPVGDGSLSGPEDSAVKTELADSSKTDPAGAFPTRRISHQRGRWIV